MIRPMFIKDRLRNLAIFDACTEKLLSKLPPSGQTVELKDLFYRWTLDTTTDFLLGENVHSLDQYVPCSSIPGRSLTSILAYSPDSEVANAMQVAQRIQMYIFVLK